MVAAHVVERLELHCDGAAHDAVADLQRTFAADETTHNGFEQAVDLEVRRLAARSRAERELLDSRLTSHLRADHRFGSVAADWGGRLLSAAISQAAVRKLTDISVTPRELRRQLGIASDEETGYS
jgi:hypothetical protein